jgi:hypothetical protein
MAKPFGKKMWGKKMKTGWRLLSSFTLHLFAYRPGV